MPIFFVPGNYGNPIGAEGRARTIAALHITQGNNDSLSEIKEMRRDVLNKLMSPSAVSYWLNTKQWLRLGRKIDGVQLLHLTSDGLRTCINSVAGGSEVPTSQNLVNKWRHSMVNGGHGLKECYFKEISSI